MNRQKIGHFYDKVYRSFRCNNCGCSIVICDCKISKKELELRGNTYKKLHKMEECLGEEIETD